MPKPRRSRPPPPPPCHRRALAVVQRFSPHSTLARSSGTCARSTKLGRVGTCSSGKGARCDGSSSANRARLPHCEHVSERRSMFLETWPRWRQCGQVTSTSIVVSPAALRRSGRSAHSKFAILTFAILPTTLVRAFTNLRLGKIKFVNVVTDCAQQSRFPFRWHVTEIGAGRSKTAFECASCLCT
jgi:hypothetical protein